MSRLALLSIALSSCSPWGRPRIPDPQLRDTDRQADATVRVESYCDPFDDGTLGRFHVGSGVMVSGWQVLTAIHVVDCQVTPVIHVINGRGHRWRFIPEREWEMTYVRGRDGVSRIQMADGSTLEPELPPPTVRPFPLNFYDPLYLEVASPSFVEQVEEATGWEYGGEEYGGKVVTYDGPSEGGNSGGALYDLDGDLAALHLGRWRLDDLRYGAVVTSEMIPH